MDDQLAVAPRPVAMAARVAGALALLVACSRDGGTVPNPAPTAVTTIASGPGFALGHCRTTPGSSRADFDGLNGEFAVWLYGVDLPARTVSFDVIQFLVGEDALREHRRLNPTDPGGPPNDYITVNALVKTDTAKVSTNPVVYLYETPGSHRTATFDELARGRVIGRHPGLGLYWLTFKSGQVIQLCQQFTP